MSCIRLLTKLYRGSRKTLPEEQVNTKKGWKRMIVNNKGNSWEFFFNSFSAQIEHHIQTSYIYNTVVPENQTKITINVDKV